MPNVALRDYTEADLPALCALDQVCVPPGIAYSRAELRSFLHHPSSFTTVAVAAMPGHTAPSIWGFAIVRPVRRRLREGDTTGMAPVLHVLTIDVAPEARRRGVGGLLMEWMVARGQELNLRAIVLEVSVDNDAAQRFYQRFGFCTAGVLPGYYNGTTDALELERSLPQPD